MMYELGRKHKKIQIVLVNNDEAKLDCFKNKSIFTFYFKGKQVLSIESAGKHLIEEKLNELDPEIIKNLSSDPANVFTSKEHPHQQMIKMKRLFILCSKCGDDFLEEPTEVYFCPECQYNLCENCKLIEEGKEVVKKESPIQLVSDAAKFKEIISENHKIATYFYDYLTDEIQSLKTLAEEYKKEVKFIRVKKNDSTKALFDEYDIESNSLLIFSEGKKVANEGDCPSVMNIALFKLSGRQPEVKVKISKHEHELFKIKLFFYRCMDCETPFYDDRAMELGFRCMEPKCQFYLCQKCYEKYKNEGEEKKEE